MKKSEMLFVCILFLLFSSQCKGGDRETYGCVTDADCMNACALGAVNRTWYAKYAVTPTCMDGCAGQAARPSRCIDQHCTAFQFEQYNDYCTKGPKPSASKIKELTRYVCDRDVDCLLSCQQGAVNARWYKQWTYHATGFQECEGGCESINMAAKCENHICEAYLDGKKYPECTKK